MYGAKLEAGNLSIKILISDESNDFEYFTCFIEDIFTE